MDSSSAIADNPEGKIVKICKDVGLSTTQVYLIFQVSIAYVMTEYELDFSCKGLSLL